MISTDGSHYYWMRIVAQIVLWKEDQSIHMFTYRQNIDTMKRQEKQVLDQIQRDPMTGCSTRPPPRRKSNICWRRWTQGS
mgnify:CR=1 FL=1